MSETPHTQDGETGRAEIPEEWQGMPEAATEIRVDNKSVSDEKMQEAMQREKDHIQVVQNNLMKNRPKEFPTPSDARREALRLEDESYKRALAQADQWDRQAVELTSSGKAQGEYEGTIYDGMREYLPDRVMDRPDPRSFSEEYSSDPKNKTYGGHPYDAEARRKAGKSITNDEAASALMSYSAKWRRDFTEGQRVFEAVKQGETKI